MPQKMTNSFQRIIKAPLLGTLFFILFFNDILVIIKNFQVKTEHPLQK